MRKASALAALTLSVSLLAGCGGNSTDAYCSDLKKDKSYFDSLGKSDFSKFDNALDRLHSLADEAPDAVAKDWKTFDDALTKLQKALKDAGVSFSDLGKAQSGSLDADKLKKLQSLAPKLQELSSNKVQKASKAIESHAKKECKVSLT